MKVYVSHHIHPIDKDTWHLPHLKLFAASWQVKTCSCIRLPVHMQLGMVSEVEWDSIGLLLPQACSLWEDNLLMGIIRKTAAWGGLRTAPVYLKVMCLITLLTSFSMWGSMRIFWDILCFFSHGFKLIWYLCINSPCTLEAYNRELSMLLRDSWKLLFQFCLSEHQNGDTAYVKEMWCFHSLIPWGCTCFLFRQAFFFGSPWQSSY